MTNVTLLEIKRARIHFIHLIKYVAVGGFGALSYVIFSYIITNLGVRPWVSSLIVYCCLIPIIYLMQKFFVFRSQDSHRATFPKYLFVQFLALFLSAALPFGFELFGVKPEISFIVVVFFITMINYVLHSRWAFKKKPPEEDLL